VAWCAHQGCGQWRAIDRGDCAAHGRATVHTPATRSAETALGENHRRSACITSKVSLALIVDDEMHSRSRAARNDRSSISILFNINKLFQMAWCEHQGCGQWRAIDRVDCADHGRATVHIPATRSAETALGENHRRSGCITWKVSLALIVDDEMHSRSAHRAFG